jgi:hypothetical protein
MIVLDQCQFVRAVIVELAARGQIKSERIQTLRTLHFKTKPRSFCDDEARNIIREALEKKG